MESFIGMTTVNKRRITPLRVIGDNKGSRQHIKYYSRLEEFGQTSSTGWGNEGSTCQRTGCSLGVVQYILIKVALAARRAAHEHTVPVIRICVIWLPRRVLTKFSHFTPEKRQRWETKSLLFLITMINDESTFSFQVSFSRGENIFHFRLGRLKSLSVFLSH